MSKKNLSEIEKGGGYFLGLTSNLMDVVREKAVPFAAIYRLATAGGRTTLGKIVDLAYADWQAEQPQPPKFVESEGGHAYRDAPTNGNTLPANHYSVRVTYAPMPSFADLKKEFGEDNVSVIFDGREWKLDSSCVGMDRTPGEKIFLVKDFGRRWESDEAIAWGLAQRTAVAPNGYRPVTHEEEYEFQKAHPELFNLVALGSFTLHGGFRYVAGLWDDGNRRVLVIGEFGDRWGASRLCLFVSK